MTKLATRREFLAGSSAAFLGAFFGAPKLFADAPAAGRTYSLPVLGDIHFDSSNPKHYHAAYTHCNSAKRYAAHLLEHIRNADMWSGRMQNLVRASAACAAKDAPFVLQMGDFVQGDCGNGEMHRTMLDDAYKFVKGAYGKRPLLTVAGNHDIRGAMKGDRARETFEKWYPEMISRETGARIAGTTFSYRCGPDVFIFVDFNSPNRDFPLVKELLAACEDARYTFIVTHGPVIPAAPTRWFLLGERARDAERRELRAILARRNAIVLGGHTHRLEFVDCEFPEGRITQFVFNSVWLDPDDRELKPLVKGAEGYAKLARTGCLPGKEPNPKATAVMFEYLPYLKTCLVASAVGHYTLQVSDEHVDVAFYAGDSIASSRTFRLR